MLAVDQQMAGRRANGPGRGAGGVASGAMPRLSLPGVLRPSRSHLFAGRMNGGGMARNWRAQSVSRGDCHSALLEFSQ